MIITCPPCQGNGVRYATPLDPEKVGKFKRVLACDVCDGSGLMVTGPEVKDTWLVIGRQDNRNGQLK